MFESFDFAKYEKTFLTWFYDHVWTASTLSQIGLLLLIWAASAGFYQIAAPRLVNAINKWQIPPKLKQTMHTLRRQLFPFTALFLLFLVKIADMLDVIPGEGDILQAAMLLLLAWLVIRLALEVIKNNFVRNLVAAIIWGIAALSILGVLDQTAAMMDAVGMNFGKFRFSILSVSKAVFAITLLLYGASFIASLLERKVLLAAGFTPASRVLISKTLRFTLIIFALLIGVTSAGIDLSLLAVFSGALGLGAGLGLQRGISNLFCGFLLLMDKSVKPGDIIELPNGAFGWVHHMGARYTEIITRDNKSFQIPNEDFVTHQIVNWSHGDTLIRLETKFGVHHESDPHLVKRISEEAAARPERVVDTPKPQCHIVEFSDSAIVFVLRFWIRDAEKGVTNITGDVMLALWDTFKDHGIKLPYAQRDIYIKQMPETEKGL